MGSQLTAAAKRSHGQQLPRAAASGPGCSNLPSALPPPRRSTPGPAPTLPLLPAADNSTTVIEAGPAYGDTVIVDNGGWGGDTVVVNNGGGWGGGDVIVDSGGWGGDTVYVDNGF